MHDLDGRLAAVTSLLALHGFSVTVRASQSQVLLCLLTLPSTRLSDACQVSEEGYMTFVPPELRLFLVFATASRLVASTAHNQQSI